MSILDGQLPEHLKGPPAHLSAEASAFFLHVVATGSYDAEARTLLIRYCEVGDELQRIRAERAGGPVTFTDKHGQPRIHPIVKHELALTNEYGKLFRLLGWDLEGRRDDQGKLFG